MSKQLLFPDLIKQLELSFSSDKNSFKASLESLRELGLQMTFEPKKEPNPANIFPPQHPNFSCDIRKILEDNLSLYDLNKSSESSNLN